MLMHLRRQCVAYLALFIAIGGTSYAAVSLPRNSVTALQIARGAVGSSEIKNGSVTAADLAAGLAGQPGPAGPRGLTGLTGATGPAGPVWGQSQFTILPGTGPDLAIAKTSPFTMPYAGKLMATQLVSNLSVTCSDGGSWRAILMINDEIAPGYTSALMSSGATIPFLAAIGISTTTYPAGTTGLTSAIGIVCNTGTVSGIVNHVDNGYTHVVIGS